MRWSIVTPDASAHWGRHELRFGPGAPRHTAPAPDELEDLFRTYYRNIFNPARLNLRAMRAEMPRKHWATLPEASIIGELTREAPQRTRAMLDARPPPPPPPPAVRTLPVLREAASTCRACELCRDATQTVFGEGPAGARLMLVGEHPATRRTAAAARSPGPPGSCSTGCWPRRHRSRPGLRHQRRQALQVDPTRQATVARAPAGQRGQAAAPGSTPRSKRCVRP
jgi:DNA polymerase